MDIGIPKMDIVGFRSKHKLKRIFLKTPNIKYLFFGHVHRQISGIWAGVPYSCVKGINHQVSYQNGMQELYFTNQEKPAYNVVELFKNYVNVNSHEFLDEDEFYLADY
jgi:chorismate mutase